MEVELLLRRDAGHIVKRLNAHRLVRRKGLFLALPGVGTRKRRRERALRAPSFWGEHGFFSLLFFFLPPSPLCFGPGLSSPPPLAPWRPSERTARGLACPFQRCQAHADIFLERVPPKQNRKINRSRRQQRAISARSRRCTWWRWKRQRRQHRLPLRRRRRRCRWSTPSRASPGSSARAASL